ncbi:MAG: hypothetical protein JW825_06765 [Candidatus Methanofastidiosa archaeon]|nr:hypothetical protein [Candidatus Methanofastidiosa archaeon]
MRKMLIGILLLSLVVSICGCISGGEDEGVEWDIQVFGEISSPFSISYSELQEMPEASIEKKLVSGAETYTGVSLEHITELANISEGVNYVNCIADDGYILSFTLNDFQNGILALEKGGKPLDDDSGPVMLGFNIGCACNWMKRVEKIEFFSSSNSLGLIGDVANPIYVTISDIRDFTGKENSFTVAELFTKVAAYPQSQTFSIICSEGEYNYPIGAKSGAIVTYAGNSFKVSIEGTEYSDVSALDCIWDPDQ